MPRLWDRSKREKRTPFSDVLADYLAAHPWMRPKHIAVDTKLSATTIQRYLNGEVVPHDPRILQQIHAGTGIPLAKLYEAAGLWLPAAPRPLDEEQPPRRQPTRRKAAEHTPDPVYAALRQFLRQLRVQPMDEATRQAIIDSYLDSLLPLYPDLPSRPILAAWREQIWQEEHDHDHISTLHLPAIASAARETDESSQQESQPVVCDV